MSSESPLPLTYLSEAVKQQPVLDFAMGANGFIKDGETWTFNPGFLRSTKEQYRGQQVSYFGPNGEDHPFFTVDYSDPFIFIRVLGQPSVSDVVNKYRRIDASLAFRVSYLLGGVARQMLSDGSKISDTVKGVDYVAGITKLGEGKSGDSIASSIALYVISGGSTKHDADFNGWVYRMAEAIKEDPIAPTGTIDLGTSQVARLRGLIDRRDGDGARDFPNIGEQLRNLDGFPTVGAEFHFPLKDPDRSRSFWRRVALLNMSQYQKGSYIQLSRTDREVVEIRMNPSVYPVTIANWRYIKGVLPEIENAFFTMTFNRPGVGENLDWKNSNDKDLLRAVRGLGFLTYAALFGNVPSQDTREEIDFGDIYLGQTVRVEGGEYSFDGYWGGGEGHCGQFGIFAGFGKNFPHLAYYPSMAFASSDVLNTTGKALRGVSTLASALSLAPHERSSVFGNFNRAVTANPKLRMATRAGNRIVSILTA